MTTDERIRRLERVVRAIIVELRSELGVRYTEQLLAAISEPSAEEGGGE